MSLPPVIKGRIQLQQVENQVGAYHLYILTMLLIKKKIGTSKAHIEQCNMQIV